MLLRSRSGAGGGAAVPNEFDAAAAGGAGGATGAARGGIAPGGKLSKTKELEYEKISVRI